MTKGKIVQVMGPVVDVEFESKEESSISSKMRWRLTMAAKRCVMEVAQHIGNNIARCIMLASSDGLCTRYGSNRYRSRYQSAGRRTDSGTSV